MACKRPGSYQNLIKHLECDDEEIVDTNRELWKTLMEKKEERLGSQLMQDASEKDLAKLSYDYFNNCYCNDCRNNIVLALVNFMLEEKLNEPTLQ